jgi:hypothetical protein
MGRVNMALKAGYQTGITTYKQGALVPLTDGADDEWGVWASRALRYLHGKHYYYNTAYSALQVYARQYKVDHKLYPNIRPVYNPVFRLVSGYVAVIWGGNLDYDTLTDGAIPLDGLDGPDGPLTTAIRQLWRWSNWGTVKNRVVRTGATCGDAAIKIVADMARGKVRLEPLDPGLIQGAVFDSVGNLKEILIGYKRRDSDDSPAYLYQELITKESFATYKDGQLYAYPENTINGEAVAAWPNPYGFVPVVLAPHVDVGKYWGASAYHTTLPKIDELNDLASKTNDLIRMALNPTWFASGVAGPTDLEFREADPMTGGLQVNVLYGPNDATMTALVPQVDLGSALQNISQMLAELERDLPELALPSLREKGELTAPGVRAGFADAIARYTESRGQYDDALIRAHMMGISIGAYHRLPGFEPFSLESYAAGNLEHYVQERSVIEDSLTLLERVNVLTSSRAPSWMIWKLCGMSDEEIQMARAEQLATERILAGEFGRAVVGGVTGAAAAPGEEE